MKYKAVIFDMDGLLLDTERMSISTFIEACREHDFEPDMSVYYKCIGVDWGKTKEILSAGYGEAFPLELITELWTKKMDRETTEKPIPMKTGAFSLLKYLEKEDIKMAVVTSTRTDIAKRELSNAKISHFFLFILGGDQVMKGKPDPEIYLTACRKLDEEPLKCLALEDSDNGTSAAFHAGLEVIQIPDLVSPSADVRNLGHRIVGSLVEVENLLRKSDTVS